MPVSIARHLYDDAFYGTEPQSALLARLRPEDRIVLDVGCGSGANAAAMKRDGRQVHGVTLSEKEAAAYAPHAERVEVADIESWAPSYRAGFFDAILLSHVLEHLVDPWTTLGRLGHLLKREGRVYVGLPNVAHWRLRWQFLRGRFEYQEMGPMDHRHLRFFTHSSARELLERAGFDVVWAGAGGHLPVGPVRRLWPSLFTRIDRGVVRLRPNFFGYESYFVAQKKCQ